MRATALAAVLLLASAASAARAASPLSVVYAGSMGAVMDRGIAPAFTAKTGIPVQGHGQGALGLARLIAAGTLSPDMFVSISAAPIRIVQDAGLAGTATPVATTAIVLAYAPHSRFAAAIRSEGVAALASPGLRIGRTDPANDPLGQYSLFTLQLAGLELGKPDFASSIAGPAENPAQVFAEPSILARLAAGQMDASFAYRAFAVSQHVPFVTLPPALDFSDPKRAGDYARASVTVTVKGKPVTTHPSPLIYYGVVLRHAAHPQAAASFLDFLRSAAGQAILQQAGYGSAKGDPI